MSTGAVSGEPGATLAVRAEGALLVLALAALGLVFVPAHWVSIWMDPEFTGGIGPLANRLVDGQRLYTDGMHSPLPPLSFVLMRLVGGGDATWLTGSVVNYVLQTLTLLVSWLALRRTFGHRVAFLAAVCAIPIFLALPKTVVYDSAVQLCVALAAWTLAVLPRRWPVLLGAISAVAILTKQSTGAGLVAGVLLGLLVAGAAGTPREPGWWKATALYLGSTLIAFGLLVVALVPWASPGGLVHDVLRTGSEPKGGKREVLDKATEWFVDVGWFVLAIGLAVGVIVLAGRRFGVNERIAGLRDVSWSRPARRLDGDARGALRLAVAAVAGAALGAASWALESPLLSDPLIVGPDRVDTLIRENMNQAMLAAVLALALAALWRVRGRGHATERRFLRVFAVLFGAALGHSLSSPGLRWTYDDNPLIPFALGCLIVTALWVAGLLGARLRGVAAIASVFLLSAVCWASLGNNIEYIRRADVAWPEVSHLDGARLRPGAAGMRRLVARVRTLAGPREPVLLLPEDPNVQAWFERPRPHLTSAMVFVDQYWDRYVDEDFDRLAADPPKVVIVGPRGFWRFFQHVVQTGRGAERLIDRLQTELLPRRYTRVAPVKIRFRDGDDWMDVWVRRR